MNILKWFLFLISVFLLAILLTGCENRENVKSKVNTIMFSDGGVLSYKIVEIDGVQYYCSRTYQGNYVIGPKIEGK